MSLCIGGISIVSSCPRAQPWRLTLVPEYQFACGLLVGSEQMRKTPGRLYHSELHSSSGRAVGYARRLFFRPRNNTTDASFCTNWSLSLFLVKKQKTKERERNRRVAKEQLNNSGCLILRQPAPPGQSEPSPSVRHRVRTTHRTARTVEQTVVLCRKRRSDEFSRTISSSKRL